MSIGIPIHLVMGSHKLASTISSVGSCIKFFTSGKMTTSLLKYLVPLNFLGACLGVYVLNMIDEKILEPLIIFLLFFFTSGKMTTSLLKYLVPLNFLGACLGVYVLNMIDEKILEPLIIFLLFVMLIYTVVNKNIGLEDNFKGLNKKNIIAGCIMSTVIGFYNGFFGPGTGSFLLFAFIKIYGMDFVISTGNAKVLNLVGNFASLIMFIYYGNIEYTYSFLLFAFIKIYGMDFVISTGNAKVLNLVGNFASLIMFIYYGNIEYTYALIFGAVMFFGGHCGAKLAISKGGKFVKPFFVIVTSITLAKMVISKFF